MWVPEVIRPTPEPWFVKEITKIDKALQVVWGYERYFVNKWALERKMTPERYHAAYKSVLKDGGPRYVDQPIFDSTSPIFNEDGEIETYEQIGVRKYDLCPEWEWVAWFDHLNEDALVRIRKSYAWERNHPISRIKFEMEQEQKAIAEAQKAKRNEVIRDGVEEAFHALRKKVVFGYGQTRSENNTV